MTLHLLYPIYHETSRAREQRRPGGRRKKERHTENVVRQSGNACSVCPVGRAASQPRGCTKMLAKALATPLRDRGVLCETLASGVRRAEACLTLSYHEFFIPADFPTLVQETKRKKKTKNKKNTSKWKRRKFQNVFPSSR